MMIEPTRVAGWEIVTLIHFFVGWGTLSLINAGLAQTKGRSGPAWWLLSLPLGPIATFLIVVLPSPYRFR
jgi:hypothetical protein